jgi:hypothetical protein
MALSATLAELETWIRQDADMQAPDDRVTSEECRNRINRSLAQLYDRLVLVDQEYFLKGVTLTSNGSGKYDIMNDFATGVVRSVTTVQAGGSGYTNGSTVTLSQGANATATGIVSASGGAITGITLASGGFGYVDAPLSTQGWELQVSTGLPSPVLAGPAVIIGNEAFYLMRDVVTADATVRRVDLTTGATTSSAVFSTDAQPNIALHVPSNQIVAVDFSGNFHVINPTTLSVNTFVVSGIPSFKENGVFYDPITTNLFAATAGALYELDITGAIVNSLVSATIQAFVGLNTAGAQPVLYYQLTGSGDLVQNTGGPFGAPSVVDTYATQGVASAVYSATANKLFMSFFGTGSSARYYDFNTSSSVDIEPTLTTAGYTPGPCFVSYDTTTDAVMYASYVIGSTANVVVEVSAATDAVTASIATAAGVNVTAARVGQRVITAGYAVFMVAPTSTTMYIYEYVATPVSVPNYVLLNVSGGIGGQVVAYIESDFYKCKGVWFTDGSNTEPDNGNWSPLRRFSWEQQNALNQAALYGGMTALPLYRIVTEGNRDKLVISPDQLSGSYKLWYYPAPQRLLIDTDRFDGRAGWDEWIVKDVAIQLLMAEESVEQAATLKNVRDEIWQRIQLHAEDREAAQPQRIMDATLLSRRYGPRWGR